MQARYWPDEYVRKKRTAKEALSVLKSGRRIFIGSSCGEPQHLVNTLVEEADRFSDLEIVRLMGLERSPITRLVNQDRLNSFHVRNIYQGAGDARHLAPSRPFITPINMSAVPDLFRKNQLPLHAALIQTSPPDDFGWMSLGISVDVGMAAATSADIVIVQVNARMPRVLGHSFIHVNDVDFVVECDEPLYTIPELPELESAHKIGRLVANLIEDGSTFQLGLGATPKAILLALSEKNDLGVHTQFVIDGIMDLVSRGVITNRRKGLNEGKIVASNAVGTENLYEFVHDNPSIEFFPADYVSNPGVIARHNKMVVVNMVKEMDLVGQASVDALPHNYFAGVSSIPDFVHGAAMAPGGRSILLIPSTSVDRKTSRIVPRLSGNVVVSMNDAGFVVSEFGAVNLFGKNLQERATAMISLAHPDFREALFEQARDMGLLAPGRKLSESLRGVYPAGLEETRTYDGQTVKFRPAKPVDDRRIQEHFYNLDKKDVIARFFQNKTCFFRDDLEGMYEIDYIKNLTILAVTGDFGFGEVVGIGAYMLESPGNMAEVAFSVSRPWQGKGIATVILHKLAYAAMGNGIAGLVAYTEPANTAMKKLFATLPYAIKTSRDTDMVTMTCYLNDEQPAPDAGPAQRD
ncbi:bifunctional acetyl-CoA hydrolase/transferase family protein/GNAT family N-acetyltransferase [Desulfosudis oleivorans]|uniref:Acetyl-CoA hydrolase/transferase n=1 Tax=Desulfosudis oleivorans (strain DSM 6200 / JCM 39069 / Hxd3) TaxID=96561 RepID=A8ZT97_DESOH|nr:bifunctional acetyl-CoA hydrolase/transferase family protein/GNAT family N-acetyltransferase [Desulfosudis oleivorans]ABW67780.1 acetyl-CoA hydrolase/transferase [Desulfosudis oleivorans Hxd3]